MLGKKSPASRVVCFSCDAIKHLLITLGWQRHNAVILLMCSFVIPWVHRSPLQGHRRVVIGTLVIQSRLYYWEAHTCLRDYTLPLRPGYSNLTWRQLSRSGHSHTCICVPLPQTCQFCGFLNFVSSLNYSEPSCSFLEERFQWQVSYYTRVHIFNNFLQRYALLLWW